MAPISSPPPWRILLILTMGVVAVSTAAIWIRLAIAATGQANIGFSLVLAATRLSLAALFLLPTWNRGAPPAPTSAGIRLAAIAGGFLALHFATWITSLAYTSIAASATLVTTTPLWVALGSWLWLKQPLTKLTALGIGIALLGGVGVSLGETTGPARAMHPLLGNGLALIGAWAASLYFLLGREAQHRGLSLSRYAVITYSTAALILLPLPPLFHTPYSGYSAAVYGYILFLALGPQLIGHTSLNWSIRWLSPTLVSLAVLLEPLSTGGLAYLIFGEIPGPWMLVGALGILLGVAIAALGIPSVPPAPKTES